MSEKKVSISDREIYRASMKDYVGTYQDGLLAGLEIARKLVEDHEAMWRARIAPGGGKMVYDAAAVWDAVEHVKCSISAQIARRSGT